MDMRVVAVNSSRKPKKLVTLHRPHLEFIKEARTTESIVANTIRSGQELVDRLGVASKR